MWVCPCVGSLRGTDWGSRSFFHPLISTGFAARGYGDLSSRYWNLGLGAWCGAGTPCSQDIPPKFLSTHFIVSAVSTSWDGCGFFSSVVVRLPFNLISDSYE